MAREKTTTFFSRNLVKIQKTSNIDFEKRREPTHVIFVNDTTTYDVDAHHIMDRRLWKDGGYYLSNGAALCSKHHLDDDDGSLKLALENQKLLIMAKYGECNVKNNTVRSNLVK